MARYSRNRTPYVFLGIVIVLFLIFTARIAYIVVMEKDGRRSYDDPVVASSVVRGRISDRNGNVLASQTSTWAIHFRLSAIEDMEYAAMTISPYIGMTIDEIVERAGRYTTYALIKDGIGMGEAEAVRAAVEDAGLADQIDVTRQQTRSYASHFHASQLIGFMNREGVGSEGIEYMFDDVLSPYPELGESVTYGDDISLTIDLDIQYLVDVQVQNIAYEHDPDYIMAIVADAKSGDILAMSSYPWYDLNHYNVSSADERLNRCAAYNYEPGSVFKVFTLAKCIDEGIDTTTPFICDGSETFTVNGNSFTISCHTPHGQVDGRQMIAQSCNGAIASWCLQLGDDVFYEYLRSLGFGQKPDLPIPALTSGYLADPSSWSSRTKATLAFGQEIDVNALQIVSGATAIANGGIQRPLNIIHEIVDHDGTVVWQSPEEEGHRVMSSQTADLILSYMVSAVEEGTAKKAAVEGIRVAAKTGTAEIVNPETGSYADGTNLASTLVMAPADDPQYIIYFAISAPKGNSVWGADIAAPACGALVEGLARQGRIQTDSQTKIQVN